MTVTCRKCLRPVDIPVTDEAFRRWQNGALIQVAMRDVPAELREMFLSGYCPECFAALFPPEDET